MIHVYVTDFETVVLKPQTQQRIDDLPFGWRDVINDKRYRSKKSKETRALANAKHTEITLAVRDAFMRGKTLGEY